MKAFDARGAGDFTRCPYFGNEMAGSILDGQVVDIAGELQGDGDLKDGLVTEMSRQKAFSSRCHSYMAFEHQLIFRSLGSAATSIFPSSHCSRNEAATRKLS